MFDFHVWEGIKRPFPLIGQARIKWCRHHVVFSFVQHNKSPLLLKRLLQLLRSSPSHQTTRLTNGLTQTILEQCLDRAYFCVDSIMQILAQTSIDFSVNIKLSYHFDYYFEVVVFFVEKYIWYCHYLMLHVYNTCYFIEKGIFRLYKICLSPLILNSWI